MGQSEARLACLNNHCEVIAACDFFTVLSLPFRTLDTASLPPSALQFVFSDSPK
jgi:hypothetical protein